MGLNQVRNGKVVETRLIDMIIEEYKKMEIEREIREKELEILKMRGGIR